MKKTCSLTAAALLGTTLFSMAQAIPGVESEPEAAKSPVARVAPGANLPPWPVSTDAITAKLNYIILPKVDFRNATLREIVDVLKAKSKEYDSREPDPSRRGVPIVLRIADQSVAADARINLTLTNVPLGEVLRFVVSLAELQAVIDPYAVALWDKGVAVERFITKRYSVNPYSFRLDSSKEYDPQQPKVKECFAYFGVTFPPGSDVYYVPQKSLLFVKNTQKELELIDIIVNAMSNPKEK